MCVIVVKKRGIAMPTKKVLKACATANRDGFGFVSESASYKTMDFEDFYDHLKAVPKKENCIIHFRWATHGSTKVSNCHPFEHNGIYFAHNGVMNVKPYNDKTDSETAFRKYIYPMVVKFGLQSDDLREYMGLIGGTSRYAIMKDGDVALFGSYSQLDGVLYSNMNWYTRYNGKSLYQGIKTFGFTY